MDKKKQGERDPGASVLAKLRNHAKATGEEVPTVLARYINERFLYRLSLSPYAERFVLRGATLFSVWLDTPHRPTRDLDMRRSSSPAPGQAAPIRVRPLSPRKPRRW